VAPTPVLAAGLSWAPLRHALREAEAAGRVEVIPFPAEMADHPGNADPASLPGPEALRGEAGELIERLSSLIGSGEPPH